MGIVVRLDEHTATTYINLSGDFDYSCQSCFKEKCFKDEISKQTRMYILDFIDVSFIDSSGLGLLLELREVAAAHKAKIELCNLSNNAAFALKRANFDKLFTIK